MTSLWYTYIGTDGLVHKMIRKAYNERIGYDLIDEWDKVRNSEDQREVNKFLWQNCQDTLDIIRNQLGVIEVLSEMLDKQEDYIHDLEDKISRDEYGD